MNKVNRPELIRAVATATGRRPAEVEEVVLAVLAVIREETEAGRTVSLNGFGQFSVKSRAARTARNPSTGEPVQVAASRTLTFKASKATKA